MSSIVTSTVRELELDFDYTDFVSIPLTQLDTGNSPTQGLVSYVCITDGDAVVKLIASIDGETWFAILTYDMDGTINTAEISLTDGTPIYITTASAYTCGFRYFELQAKTATPTAGVVLTAHGLAK